MSAKHILIGASLVGLLGYTGVNYFSSMSTAEVVQYLTVEKIVQGAHNSALNPGSGFVVTLAVHNSHPWRDSPTRLWVSCDVVGHNPDVGDYANKIEAYQAYGQYTVGGNGREQFVPANSTANLDFATSAGEPTFDLRLRERIAGNCRVGTSMKQALVLGGFHENDQQGQYTSLTPNGTRLGARLGWHGRNE